MRDLMGYNPSRTRTRSSTSARVSAWTRPQRAINRSRETDRSASQRMADSTLTPPSGGRMTTCVAMPRRGFVTGTANPRSAGPALKRFTESTSAGRPPDCSRPRVGLKSTSQISPRYGGALTSRRSRWPQTARVLSGSPPTPLAACAAWQSLHWRAPAGRGGDMSPPPLSARLAPKSPKTRPGWSGPGGWLNSDARSLLAWAGEYPGRRRIANPKPTVPTRRR